MRQDYQILAPLIQNPFIPIEPLATYGKALNIAYNIVTDMDILEDMEDEVMQWKEVSKTTTIFPVLDTFFDWIDDRDTEVQSILGMI